MAGSEGQWLSREDVDELEARRERGVALPAKFDDVVFDNTRGGNIGAGYRYKTAGEKKIEDEQAKVAEEATNRRAQLLEKVDKEAAGANTGVENRVPVTDVDVTGRSVDSTKTATPTTTARGAGV